MKCGNPGCGKDFEARRKRAKFCSPACRVAGWRAAEGFVPRPVRDRRVDTFVHELVRLSEDPTVAMTLPRAIRLAAGAAGIDVPREVLAKIDGQMPDKCPADAGQVTGT